MTDCEDADKNPICPYLNDIHNQGRDISLIKNALIGENMQGGIVSEIQKFKILWRVTTFIAGASTTALIVIALKQIFQQP